MYKGKRILAIIPARAGSKGIPNKNIIEVAGKPLIQYSIDSAKASKYIDKLVVSTDSEQIAGIARELGADFPVLRPGALAGDRARTVDAVLHMIDSLAEMGDKYDYVLTLQATQPLRQSYHIDEAIEKIIDNSGGSLISVSEVDDHPSLMKQIDERGNLINLLDSSADIRRQDFGIIYKVDGLIYINKIDDNLNSRTSLNDNQIPYIIDKKYNLDIDEFRDLYLLESIIKKEGKDFGL